MIIDTRKPEGNIYAILGHFQKLRDLLQNNGVEVSRHTKLLENYKAMTYDQILDQIEDITRGAITFRRYES